MYEETKHNSFTVYHLNLQKLVSEIYLSIRFLETYPPETYPPFLLCGDLPTGDLTTGDLPTEVFPAILSYTHAGTYPPDIHLSLNQA